MVLIASRRVTCSLSSFMIKSPAVISVYAPREQRTHPFSPPRTQRRAKDSTKSLVAHSLKILEPLKVRDETIRSIGSEPSVGELILPLDVKGPTPEVVFALDLNSDSLLHALFSLSGANLYQP